MKTLRRSRGPRDAVATPIPDPLREQFDALERAVLRRDGGVVLDNWQEVSFSFNAPPLSAQMTLSPYSDPADIKRVAALRRWLLQHGALPHRLVATPSDLARFNLVRWDGKFCGIICVDSPITLVAR